MGMAIAERFLRDLPCIEQRHIDLDPLPQRPMPRAGAAESERDQVHGGEMCLAGRNGDGNVRNNVL